MADRADIELNRFWNELGRVGDAPAADVDPQSAALIRRMHALANAPLPVSARERVWRGLLDTYESIPEETETTMFIATDLIRPGPSVINGQPPRLRVLDPREDRPRWSNRPLAYLAVAALLLALLGAAALIRFIAWGDSSGPSKGGPAIFAPATPSPEAAGEETLLEVTLPVDVVPAGMLGSMLLSHDTIPANSVTTRASWECCPGAKVFLILDGSVSVVSDGAMQVIWHGRPGEIETMANGSEADLGPGDAVAMRNEASQTWTTGAREVDIVTQTLIAGSVPGSQIPGRMGRQHLHGRPQHDRLARRSLPPQPPPSHRRCRRGVPAAGGRRQSTRHPPRRSGRGRQEQRWDDQRPGRARADHHLHPDLDDGSRGDRHSDRRHERERTPGQRHSVGLQPAARIDPCGRLRWQRELCPGPHL